MSLFASPQALLRGCTLCFTETSVRRLALWPWLIGLLVYLGALTAAYHYHSSILHSLVNTPQGFFATILYGLAWVLVSVVLAISSFVLTIAAVFALTGVFQTAIVEETLRLLEVEPVAEASGVVRTTLRAIAWETSKLIFLLPLFCLAFILGLIPLLAPLALLLAAWLLAYQTTDLVLDSCRLSAAHRLKFCLGNIFTLVIFGLWLTLVSLIPFAALLLPPIAAAGAAIFLHDKGLLRDFTRSRP